MAVFLPIERACKIAGGLTTLAVQLGVKPPTVNEWKQGKRQVPEARCAQIERLSAGKITCDQLRPDLPWRRVPDPDWSWHKKGCPLIDAASLPIHYRVPGEEAVRNTTAREFSDRRRATERKA